MEAGARHPPFKGRAPGVVELADLLVDPPQGLVQRLNAPGECQRRDRERRGRRFGGKAGHTNRCPEK